VVLVGYRMKKTVVASKVKFTLHLQYLISKLIPKFVFLWVGLTDLS